MGWSSGSILASDAWELVRPFIKESKRKETADKFMKLFENMDADDFDGTSTLEKDAGRRRDYGKD
jgi:hypothetical protein